MVWPAACDSNLGKASMADAYADICDAMLLPWRVSACLGLILTNGIMSSVQACRVPEPGPCSALPFPLRVLVFALCGLQMIWGA